MSITFNQYQDGDISAAQALRELTETYDKLDSEVKRLSADRDALRDMIYTILRDGFNLQRQEVAGYRIEFREPSVSKGWDSKGVQSALDYARGAGLADVVEILESAQKETKRAGSLMMSKAKG